jgi:dienelactone hydrolase
MFSETITYQCDRISCQGFLAYDDSSAEKMPGVLISPTWFGCNDFAKDIALQIASLGYIAFVADPFGNGRVAKDEKEAAALIEPLYLDRNLLLSGLNGAYRTLAEHPKVDSKRLGAIGFCFGGLSVIELLKNGQNLKAVVTFHAALHEENGGKNIKRALTSDHIHGSLLILTGAKDPIATMADLDRVQNELTKSRIDWQTHIFSSAGHSFTNPDANKPDAGFYYEPIAAKRSFELMQDFLKEHLR